MDGICYMAIFIVFGLTWAINNILYITYIQPQYDNKNLYEEASCTVLNKNYTINYVKKQLYDYHEYEGKVQYGRCYECDEVLSQSPEKNCNYLMTNNYNNSGECCIHLMDGWMDFKFI